VVRIIDYGEALVKSSLRRKLDVYSVLEESAANQTEKYFNHIENGIY